MRLTAAATLFVALVACSACDQAPTEESQSADPLFAKGGGDSFCETKDFPVRDFFAKGDTKAPSDRLRDLQAYCVDSDAYNAWEAGFDLFQLVHDYHRSADYDGDPIKGAEIVAGVWDVMVYTELAARAAGSLEACPDCALPDVELATVRSALDGGVLAVVDGASTGYVTWEGDVAWGIEPNVAGQDWQTLVKYERVLVLGFPTDLVGTLADEKLIPTGFDWTVAPGLVSGALAVGSCEVPTGENKALFSHRALGATLDRLLPVGREPTYCPWSVTSESWGQRLTNLASRLIPLWPSELHATLFAGKGGAGRTTELSPFFGYDVYFEGKIKFRTQPGDAAIYETTPPGAANWICAIDATASDSGCEEGEGIQVQLTTFLGSILDAAEHVALWIMAEDNNGSWTLYPEVPVADQIYPADQGLVYEWRNLALDKPGRYLLCVTNLDEYGVPLTPNTTGLEFPVTCSEAFHILPN